MLIIMVIITDISYPKRTRPHHQQFEVTVWKGEMFEDNESACFHGNCAKVFKIFISSLKSLRRGASQ